MPRRYVLVAGRRFAGKDTVANAIAAACGGVRRSFAEQVKRDCAALYDLDFARLMHDNAYKDEHRLRLIAHGCEMRARDPHYWARCVHEASAEDTLTVISDYRFPNEAAFLRDQGATVLVVRVVASEAVRARRGWTANPAVDNDASECSLDDAPYDILVDNEGPCPPDVSAAVAAVRAMQ